MVIGNLQCVVHSRLHISLFFCIVARFSTNPKENHLIVAKRIMRYLKRIEDFDLSYKKNENFKLKSLHGC